MAEKKKEKRHYVNNPDFLAAMIVVSRVLLLKSNENGGERPRVPHYVGECLMKIAVNLIS
jgi:hypothetical protein